MHPVTLEDTVIVQRLKVDFFQMNNFFNNSLLNFSVFWRTMSTKRANAVAGVLECFYPHVATLQKRNVQFWNQGHLKLSKTKVKWPVLLSESQDCGGHRQCAQIGLYALSCFTHHQFFFLNVTFINLIKPIEVQISFTRVTWPRGQQYEGRKWQNRLKHIMPDSVPK